MGEARGDKAAAVVTAQAGSARFLFSAADDVAIGRSATTKEDERYAADVPAKSGFIF